MASLFRLAKSFELNQGPICAEMNLQRAMQRRSLVSNDIGLVIDELLMFVCRPLCFVPTPQVRMMNCPIESGGSIPLVRSPSGDEHSPRAPPFTCLVTQVGQFEEGPICREWTPQS